jgi:hypothetical protein
MISTITVDLVNGTKFHYLKGQFGIEDFKNVKLKLYYSEYCGEITCDAVLPIEFLSTIKWDKEDRNERNERYNFDCEVNGIPLALIRGRLNSMTDTEVELYFNDVLLKTSDGYKEFGGDGGLDMYNRLTKDD